MSAGERLGRLAAWAVRRRRAVLIVGLLLAATSVVLAALRLEADTGADTLVERGSPAWEATEQMRDEFGDDAAVVLVRGSLQRITLGEDLGRLLALERCLAGEATVPPGAEDSDPPPEACDELADLRPTMVVYGPGTFVAEAAGQISRELARLQTEATEQAGAAGRRAAREARREGAGGAEQRRAREAAEEEVAAELVGQILEAGIRYGLGPESQPSFDNPGFVSRLLFDSRDVAGTPKARFSYLLPNREAALVSVRMRADLTQAERSRAIELFRDAVESESFALDNGRYVMSGVPVVVEGLASSVASNLRWLLVLAALVMAVVLYVAFRPPGRLVPLLVALGAASLAFGGMALAGGALTITSLAALPVLIGLAIDFGIQFQARFDEAWDDGLDEEAAAADAARRAGPVLATALAASAAGFCALLISPIPVVRGFGLLLILGTAIAFALALTIGFSAVAALSRERSPGRRRRLPGFLVTRLGIATDRLAIAAASLRESVGRRMLPLLRQALAVAISRPRRVLFVAVLLAVTGVIAGTRNPVVTDLNELVPRSLPAIEDVNELQDATGFSGEIAVLVSARGDRDTLATAEVVGWMRTFRDAALEANDFAAERPRCEGARLCPSASVPDLFANRSGRLDDDRVTSLLDAIPPEFSQAVITRDRRRATISFGIKVGPLDRQAQVVDSLRRELRSTPPPSGVEAEVAGLPVLAAESSAALDRSRYLLALAGLLAVALVLLAVRRSLRDVLVVLVPVVLATGWSALVLAAMDVPLNPMSATLGVLVIAISTEFAVILSSRYREERERGRSVGQALRETYERAGAAVGASAATTIAGFGVLALAPALQLVGGPAPVTMLTDFGLATVVNLAVALAGVMLVLPAALVVAEERAERRARQAASRIAATPRPAER